MQQANQSDRRPFHSLPPGTTRSPPYSPGPGVTKEDTSAVFALLEAVGVAHLVTEKDLEGVTGLSGSGPAYVFVMIEALADGMYCVNAPSHSRSCSSHAFICSV